jgi:hypothetical protein
LRCQYYPGIISAEAQDDDGQSAQGRDRRLQTAQINRRIYAARCGPAGKVWVGQTRDLDKVLNRLSFSLRGGGDPRGDLQPAWSAHGHAGFAFEPPKTLTDELLDFARQSALDERTAFWRAKLGAGAV